MILLKMADFQGKFHLDLAILQPKNTTFLADFQGKNFCVVCRMSEKTEIYLKEITDFQIVNSIYSETFSYSIKPARQLMQVARLPLDSLIQISCIAVKPCPITNSDPFSFHT